MKKIYIREEQINKDLLLPKFIFDAVRYHETSLGENPAFPGEDDYPFDYTVLKERFRDLCLQMKDAGIPLANTEELVSHLGQLVTKCRELEKPIKDSLEKLCENSVNRLFAIPSGAVNINCKLVDKISYKMPTNVTPESSNSSKLRFKDVADFGLAKAAIAKRRLINSLVMGAAEYYSGMKMLYLEDLEKLNPELFDLYDRIMTLNSYLTFVTEEEMSDDNPKQGSYVEVHVGFNGKKSTIDAQGLIFPLLLHDTIKGLFELFSVYGLPADTEKAEYIVSKADFLLAEPWDMRFGVRLWQLLFDKLELGDDTNIIPYIFVEIVRLPTEEFNAVMKELFMQTEKGDEIMNTFIEKSRYNDGYQKFQNRINARNMDRAVIADSYFTASELDGYDIDGDDIYNDDIIEEGKDYSELVRYKFQGIPSEVVEKVLSIDPTKKKSYSQWLLSHWDSESKTILRNLKNGRIEQLFQFFKGNNDVQINGYRSVGAPLQEFIPDVEDEEEEEQMHNILTKTDAPTTLLHNHGWTKQVDSELANDFDIVFNDDNWIIAVPNTYEASCKLGENMKWCTAGGITDFNRGRDYYDQYLDRDGGKYYINFDMTRKESRNGVDYPFKRYQFHFESNQFMDKDDQAVSPGDIDMPDSARRFYIDHEGYDENDLISEEEKMYAYEEERCHDSYRINDDLYLNQSYNDEYEYSEPDENTDFYLFSNDDDRDPLCWADLKNPHVHDDVVVSVSDTLCVFNVGYNGGILVAVYEKREGAGWGHWRAYNLEDYITLPDNSIFGTVGDGSKLHFISLTKNGSSKYKQFSVDGVNNMFINKHCTEADSNKLGREFIEIELNDGMHSLFAMSPSDGKIECIVRRDVPPMNGGDNGYYTIDEYGLVRGVYKTHAAYEGAKDVNDPMNGYHLHEALYNGDYVISVDEVVKRQYTDDDYIEKYNILKRGDNKPLFDMWFDELVGLYNKTYHVRAYVKDNDYSSTLRSFFFNAETGERIYGPCNNVSYLDRNKNIIIVRQDEDTEIIINTMQARVMTEFKRICWYVDSNGVYPVVTVDGRKMCYDFKKNEFCHQEFETWDNLSGGVGKLHSSLFFCKLVNSNEHVIFDLANNKVVLRGLKTYGGLDRFFGFYTITYLNGKVNAFDVNQSKVLLQNSGVDSIKYFSRHEQEHVCLYADGNELILYNYETGEVMLHFDGSIKTKVGDYNGMSLECYGPNEQYMVSFNIGHEQLQFCGWMVGSYYDGNRGEVIDENTPPEVVELYNAVTGNKPSAGGQSPAEVPAQATTESRDRLSQIINEAIILITENQEGKSEVLTETELDRNNNLEKWYRGYNSR